MESSLHAAYIMAKEKYRELGVDTDQAINTLVGVPLSLHCWQGDDVQGFENNSASLSGSGLQVTGSYPGRARHIGELQADLHRVYTLLPGRHRLNLHAIYGDFGGKQVSRDALQPAHYAAWAEWGKEEQVALDFNATCFAHPLAAAGFTLSSRDGRIRSFWIEHVKRCREISAWLGSTQDTPCLHNLWIPDGMKDQTVDKMFYRNRLKEALDEIYAKKFDSSRIRDSVESKLFGIGSESFVAGSHEFYLAYALQNNLIYCLDMGHFHPTESVADKIPALLPFCSELLLHVSRGVRWDSDHVVIFNDELCALCREIVRSGRLADIHIALDFFDATLNRIGAWVIGARSVLKAMLAALLEPAAAIRACEEEGDVFGSLILLEQTKTLPLGAVWDYYCFSHNCPPDAAVRELVYVYEKDVLSKRG